MTLRVFPSSLMILNIIYNMATPRLSRRSPVRVGFHTSRFGKPRVRGQSSGGSHLQFQNFATPTKTDFLSTLSSETPSGFRVRRMPSVSPGTTNFQTSRVPVGDGLVITQL
jgi:hypothetical protein